MQELVMCTHCPDMVLALPDKALQVLQHSRSSLSFFMFGFPEAAHHPLLLCSFGITCWTSKVNVSLQGAGLEKGPSARYCLPLMDFTALNLLIKPEWYLLSGRHPNDHHLYPVTLPVSPPGAFIPPP